eukprot:8075868-Prorocentrum_lima.AAC.1
MIVSRMRTAGETVCNKQENIMDIKSGDGFFYSLARYKKEFGCRKKNKARSSPTTSWGRASS